MFGRVVYIRLLLFILKYFSPDNFGCDAIEPYTVCSYLFEILSEVHGGMI